MHVPIERAVLQIDNAAAGWLATGLTVEAGDSLALFGSGVWEAGGLSFDPRHLLWYRIGDQGAAVNFSADLELVEADSAGELFITLKPIGLYWEDARGTYPAGFAEADPLPVSLAVEAVRVRAPLAEGFAALAESGDDRARQVLAALGARKSLPEGFFYLPYLGRANVWADRTVEGRPGIHADTDDDVGIVKLPLDIPLTGATELSFDWRYDSLPALGPETEAQHHDYLSIALEFDNGQDLTWMWSPVLETGTHFGCPLPWWDSRETHYVIQSGRNGLGEWHTHVRRVLPDYREAIERPEPGRIVGIWFIANSIFGRQRAAASFANVTLSDGDSRTVIFADRPEAQSRR